MSNSGGIPELQYNHPDGRMRTRLEMDQWLRQEIPKVHWLRIIASKHPFNLPKQISWDMREIVLKHWLLDEMVRRQFIVGDQLGVNQTNSNDEGELRQFTQRLSYMVQAGNAVSPQHAEGVDMNQFQPPPPPMGGAPVPPNGQPTAYPPGPPQPPGPPGGYAQPPMPPGPPGPPAGPPQGYAQPPQPPGPPQPPPGYPQAPPQQYAPQGYAPPPPAVPSGPPMGPPPGVPQQAAPQAPAAGGRGGRRKADAAQAPAGPPPGPPMAGPPGAPQGFAPAPSFPGGPQAAPPQQQQFAPLPNGAPVQQGLPFPAPQAAAPVQQAAPAVDPAIGQKLDQVLTLLGQQQQQIAALQKQVVILATVNTVLGRGMYQKQGPSDPSIFLTELGIPLPQ